MRHLFYFICILRRISIYELLTRDNAWPHSLFKNQSIRVNFDIKIYIYRRIERLICYIMIYLFRSDESEIRRHTDHFGRAETCEIQYYLIQQRYSLDHFSPLRLWRATMHAPGLSPVIAQNFPSTGLADDNTATFRHFIFRMAIRSCSLPQPIMMPPGCFIAAY